MLFSVTYVVSTSVKWQKAVPLCLLEIMSTRKRTYYIKPDKIKQFYWEFSSIGKIVFAYKAIYEDCESNAESKTLLP